MKVAWLAWYVSVVLALLAVGSTLVTYAPQVESIAGVVFAALAGGAVGSAMLAWFLTRLPEAHPWQRSRPLWTLLIAAAAGATLLAVLVG